MKKRARRIVLAVVFLLLAIVVVKRIWKSEYKEVVHTKSVAVTSPIRKTIAHTVIVTGSIEARDYAEIYPRGPGKVFKKYLSEGDAVKKNQTILTTMRDEVGYTFKPAPVVSKIDGFIGRIYVDTGATVDVNQPVASVVQPDRMRIKLDVPEQYLSKISDDLEINFKTDTLPDDTFSAKVTSISQAIDTANRTFRVEMETDNPDNKLKHGMFARIDIPVEVHENTLAVSVRAIGWEADKRYVYKISDGKISKVPVKVGIRNTTEIEVLDGVSEGDVLASERLIELSDGEEVKIKENESVSPEAPTDQNKFNDDTDKDGDNA